MAEPLDQETPAWWPTPDTDWSQVTFSDDTLRRWAAEDHVAGLEQQAAQPAGFLRRAGDLGLGAAQGVTGLAEGAGTLYGLATGEMDNPLRTGAATMGEALGRLESPQLQARRQLADVAIQSQEGVLAQAWEAAKQYVQNPSLLSSELSKQIALMAPPLALGRGLAFTTGAARLGTGTAITAAGLQQGADIASGTFDSAIKRGASPDQALTAAREAFLGATLTSIGSAALVPGGATIERTLAGGATRPVGQGLAGTLLRGFLGEGGQEAVEEGGGQLLSNVSQQRVGLAVPTTENVGQAIGLGATLGAALGGPVSLLSRDPAVPAPELEAPLAPSTTVQGPRDLLGGTNYDIPTVFRVPDATSVNPPVPALPPQVPPVAPAPAVAPQPTGAAPTAAAPGAPTPAQPAPATPPAATPEEIAARQLLVREGRGTTDDFRTSFEQTLNLAGGDESPAITGKTRQALGRIAMGVFNAQDKLGALRDAIQTQQASANKSAVQLGTFLGKWHEQATGEAYEEPALPAADGGAVRSDSPGNVAVVADVGAGAAAEPPVTEAPPVTPEAPPVAAAQPTVVEATDEPVVSRKKKRVVTPTAPSNARAAVAEEVDGSPGGSVPGGAAARPADSGAGESSGAAAPAGAGVGADVQPTPTATVAASAAPAAELQRRAAPDGAAADRASRPAGPALEEAEDPPIPRDRSGRGLAGSTEPHTLLDADEKPVSVSRRLKLAEAVERAGADERAEPLMPKAVREALTTVLRNPTGDSIYKLGRAVGELFPEVKDEKGKRVFRSHRDTGFDIANEETVVMAAEEFVDAMDDVRRGMARRPIFDNAAVPQRAEILRKQAMEEQGDGGEVSAVARKIRQREERNAADRERADRQKAEKAAAADAVAEASKTQRLKQWEKTAAGRPAEAPTPRMVAVTEELRKRLSDAKDLVLRRTVERKIPKFRLETDATRVFDDGLGESRQLRPRRSFRVDDQQRFFRGVFAAEDIVNEIDNALFDAGAERDREGRPKRRATFAVDQDRLDRIRAMLREAGILDEHEPDLFSRRPEGPAPEGKMSVEQVRKIVDKIAGKWGNAPPIVVVPDYNGLPRNLITRAMREGARGAFHNGKVYLIAHNLSSAAEVQFVLAHETIGHYGLRAVLGDAYESTLTELANANPELALEALSLQNRHSLDPLLAIEETLADAAGRGLQLTGWQKFIAAVARALRAIGLDGVARWLTDATNIEILANDAIAALLQQSYAFVRSGQPSTLLGVGNTPLSRMAESPLWYSALQSAIEKEKRRKGLGKEWWALFNAWVQKGVIRKEEMDWYFSPEMTTPEVQELEFTKDELLAYLQQSELKLTEVFRDESGPAYLEFKEPIADGGFIEGHKQNPDRAFWGPEGQGFVFSTAPSARDDNADYFELVFSLPPERFGTFSNHTMDVHTPEVDNPVAFVRASTKTTPDGKHVLYIHEMQSDWHKPDSGAPDAPFRESWPNLIFKRVMRLAAEKNLDGVAWASTPEQVGNTENWFGFHEENGRWFASDKDVTFVVELYTRKLPEIFKKLSRQMQWGVNPEKINVAAKSETKVISSTVREDVTLEHLWAEFDLSMESDAANSIIEDVLADLSSNVVEDEFGNAVGLQALNITLRENRYMTMHTTKEHILDARRWLKEHGLSVELETTTTGEVSWFVPIADNPVLQGTVLSAQPLFSRSTVTAPAAGLFSAELRDKARASLAAGATNTSDFLGRRWMSTLHMRSLADDFARELPLAPDLVDLLFEKEASITANATEADQLVRDFERMADREILTNLLFDETTSQLWSDRPFEKQKHVAALVKKLVAKDPSLTPAAARAQLRAEHERLAAMFQRLNPPGKAMLKRIRRLMYARRQALIRGMERFITQLEDDPRARAKRIKEIRRAFTFQAGPYFPLLRFGDFGLAVYDKDNQLVEFTFVETPAQSEAEKARMTREFSGHSVRQFKRAEIDTQLGGIRDSQFVESIRTMIGNRIEDPALARSLQTAVQQLFVQSLPEYNARQRFLPRKNVPGFSKDAPRVLGQHVLSSLRHEAALRFNPSIQAGLQDVGDFTANDPRKRRAFLLRTKLANGHTVVEVHASRMAVYKRLGELVDDGQYVDHDLDELRGDDKEVRAALQSKVSDIDLVAGQARTILDRPMPGNTATAKDVEQEIRQRIAATYGDEPSKVVALAGNLTYVWYLGVTPSFVLANLSQNPLVTLPMLASRYGMRRASGAMAAAAKQLGPDLFRAVRGGWRTGTFDVKKLSSLAADEQRLMQYLLNRNLLDLTQSIDLGTVAEGGGAAMRAWRRAMKYATLTGHYSEIYNRLVAALTAYRLSAERETDEQARFQYAYDVISRTHGDYSAINRPGIMTRNTLLRLGFQFRNYAFMMTHHILRMVREAWKGETEEVRAEARRMLMYSMGTGLLLAGARGLPFYTTFLLTAALLGIDDPEEQMLAFAERTTGSRTAADVLFKGLPFLAGGDLSVRIGLGSTLPFSNVLEGRSTREGESVVTGAVYDIVAGPFGGIALSALTKAPDFWAQGDVVKAVEAVSPKVIRDISQAFRFGTEGVTTRRGDMLLAAEALNGFEIFWKAIGVQPSDVSSVYQDRGHVIRLARRALDERKAFLARYRTAMLVGDLEAANEVRLEANEWNREHPATPIKPRAFIDAVKRQSARNALLEATGGRAATDQEAQLLRQLIIEAEGD